MSFVDMSNYEIPNNMARTIDRLQCVKSFICYTLYVICVMCNTCLYVVPVYQRFKICNNIYMGKEPRIMIVVRTVSN